MASLTETVNRAAAYAEPGTTKIDVLELPIPRPAVGEILVRLAFSGVCHTDYAFCMNEFTGIPATPVGQIGGHEGVGEVVAVGDGVHNIFIGKKVGIKYTAEACLNCENCLVGGESSCTSAGAKISGYMTPGTFQQFCITSAQYATLIPDGLDLAEAAPLMCGGVSVYAGLKRSGVQVGDWVVISGAGGGLGHLAIQYARAMGARVLAIDSGAKEAFCLGLGADEFIDFAQFQTNESLAQHVHKVTTGGAKVALICSASGKVYNQAPSWLRFRGCLVALGIPDASVAQAISIFQVVSLELRLIGVKTGSRLEVKDTADDVSKAIEAAQSAAAEWALTPWSERQTALNALADAVEGLSDDFARLLVQEQGKPLWLARHEVTEAIRHLRGTAQLVLTDTKIETVEEPYRRVFSRHVPLGVAVGIVPWNYPLYLAIGKLGPAVLAGNAFILKPSPFTPYTGLKLAELAQDVFPPGVVQALSGDESLGPLLTTHRGVDKVSFTGSTETGKKVMASCSQTLKRVTLELGGNDAAIVCGDVDPAVVGPKVALLALVNSGQICIAVKRVYVHASIYDEVLAAMAAFVKTLTIGDGLLDNPPNHQVMLGPVTNELQFNKVKDLLADVASQGQSVAVGSTEVASTAGHGGTGFFIQPTIVDNPPDTSRIVVEEPFGPVFPVLKWSDEADLIRRVNDTDAGLGASVWSKDVSQASRIADRLEVGNVWINTHGELQANAPFAGCKSSGIGVAFGTDGLKAYCNIQTVYVKHLE
ncbi:hypothetical protein SBRCBS47491_007918 [Sporothrix bragantina]|uniref:aldehyde dehydrogenase (NAD(+)) n=1 Tax=Sporothrix bragantina TaxID=671064 RepID=A0ABP0CHN7_9PEZI